MADRWTVPTPMTVLELPFVDGARISVRRHGNPEGPRIVLSHGNGLSADTYYPYWSLLEDRFDLFVYDLRNHGHNPVGERRLHSVPAFVRDLERIVRAIERRFGRKPLIGVFHSLSALISLLLEQKQETFSALVLFDPPICPPGGAPDDLEVIGQKMSRDARKRVQQFDSLDDFVKRLETKPAFRRLRPGIAHLLASTTLRPADGGTGYELRCPREYEAQVYEYTFGWAMEIDLERTHCQTKAIGSDPTEPFSFMPSMDLSTLVDLDYDFLPETTHFLQLEDPQRCVDLTVEFLEERALA